MADACPSISFVIPVRNDAARLCDCLASVAMVRPEGGPVEVIVADNGSTDDSATVARVAGARVLALPGLRVAGVRNEAVRAAQGDVLAFVDADHVLSPGWLAAALESIARPDVVAVGAPYHAPAGGTWVQRMYDALRVHGARVSDAAWLGSGNLVIRRDAFLAAGGFDVALETCEDVDLCQRLRANGGRVLDDPRMRSTHAGDPATLAALFFGELWRGRDNLRASFRSPITRRDLPSIVIPLANLVLLGVGVLGLVAASRGGLLLTASAMMLVGALACLRAAVLLRRLRSASPAESLRALAFALTYDIARALAPVWRGSHDLRRQRAGAAS